MKKSSDAARVSALLEELGSKQGTLRQAAREQLVALGRAATGGLIHALAHADPRVRWEAAKALEEIRDPRAAPILVDALDDADRDVRWVAAVALIALGGDSLVSVLDALCRKPESLHLRERARHVLGALRSSHGSVVEPVLDALEHSPTEALPAAARAAYAALKQGRGDPS